MDKSICSKDINLKRNGIHCLDEEFLDDRWIEINKLIVGTTNQTIQIEFDPNITRKRALFVFWWNNQHNCYDPFGFSALNTCVRCVYVCVCVSAMCE